MNFNPLTAKPPARPGIEPVLPLINVVFLLLIFFLMTGKMQKSAVPAIVPPEQIAEKRAIESDPNDWLYLDVAGELTWRGISVSDAELIKEAPSPVVLFADGDVTGKVLNQALAKLSATDIREVAVVTEKVLP